MILSKPCSEVGELLEKALSGFAYKECSVRPYDMIGSDQYFEVEVVMQNGNAKIFYISSDFIKNGAQLEVLMRGLVGVGLC